MSGAQQRPEPAEKIHYNAQITFQKVTKPAPVRNALNQAVPQERETIEILKVNVSAPTLEALIMKVKGHVDLAEENDD